MQQTWHVDPDKCTFIVLAKKDAAIVSDSCTTIPGEGGAMVGDVNLFFVDGDRTVGELSLMIAEPSVRKQGIASEAALMMMKYGAHHLGVKEFVVKISDGNDASINLFKKLGYDLINHDEDFEETEFRFTNLGKLDSVRMECAPYTHPSC